MKGLNIRRSMMIWGSLVATGILLVCCDDTNYFGSLNDTSSDEYLLEEAKIEIDREHYDEALSLVQKVSEDSNEKRILWASALLASEGLGLLDIIGDTFDSAGTDNFFDNLDDAVIFGTGAVKDQRLSALKSSIEIVSQAPNPTTGTKNLACVLAGLLAKPTITDGRAAIESATANLETIVNQATGAGTNADECPGISEFEINLETITSVQSDLTAILATISDCPILDLAGSDLNSIEAAMNKLNTGADKGCEELSCTGPICDALKLTCVNSLIDTSSNPVAGDGDIQMCELVQNCAADSSACF